MRKNGSWIALVLVMASACASNIDDEGEPANGGVDEFPPEEMTCPPQYDDAAGRGLTAAFEVAYLTFIIDHHFAALRMTELVAGTDRERTPELIDTEGTAQTPGFEHVDARARLPELRSLARSTNRKHREQIVMAQQMLVKWYGIDHQPVVRPEAMVLLAELEAIGAGDDFDRRFIEVFSRHHFSAVGPSTECQVSRELQHQTLETFCRRIVEVQVADVQDLRQYNCRSYGVCDLVPVELSQIPVSQM